MVELPRTEGDAPKEGGKDAPKRYVADNTSFAPLAAYLEGQSNPELCLSFAEVETILGRPLCKSAYKYASYWYPGYNRPVSNVVFNAGYDVGKVDLEGRAITLTRPEQSLTTRPEQSLR